MARYAKKQKVEPNVTPGQRPEAGSIPANNWFINKKVHSNVALFRPQKDVPEQDNRPAFLWFRPWPALSFADPSEVLERGRSENGGMTHWIRAAKGVEFVGESNRKRSWLLYPLTTPIDEQYGNPYRLLYWAVRNAEKEFKNKNSVPSGFDMAWASTVSRGVNEPAILPGYNNIWFIQASVYESAGVSYITEERGNLPLGIRPDDPLPVVMIPNQAAMRLIVGDVDKGVQPLLDTVSSKTGKYLYGDPVGEFDSVSKTVRGGLFMCVFLPSPLFVKKKELKSKFSVHSTWNGELANIPSYEVLLSRSYFDKADSADLDADAVQQIFNKWTFWSLATDEAGNDVPGLLYYPSYEEQALFIAQSLPSYSKLLQYAWRDYPQYFTDEVQAVLRGRTFHVPSTSPSASLLNDDQDLENNFRDEPSVHAPVAGPCANDKPFEPLRPPVSRSATPANSTDSNDEDGGDVFARPDPSIDESDDRPAFW